jgi:hypothetical protein
MARLAKVPARVKLRLWWMRNEKFSWLMMSADKRGSWRR